MTKVLIACDKFKGTFTSKQIGEKISEILTNFDKDISTEILEVSDGGDGFTTSLWGKNNFSRWKFLSYSANPLRRVQSQYLYDIYTSTAVLESSLTLSSTILKSSEKNILKLSSYGLGFDINRLLEVRKPKKLVIGVGGTSTNDLFFGGAYALGFKFLDSLGNEINPLPENFMQIVKIIKPENFSRYEKISIEIAVDVKNPLLGPSGAAEVFAPQKGATQNDIHFLEKSSEYLCDIIKRDLGVDITSKECCGAGGGIGGGLYAFLGGKFISGADFILVHTDFDNKLDSSDIVITGEGKFDSQSLEGKLTSNIIFRCQKKGKKVYVVCGQKPKDFNPEGINVITLEDLSKALPL